MASRMQQEGYVCIMVTRSYGLAVVAAVLSSLRQLAACAGRCTYNGLCDLNAILLIIITIGENALPSKDIGD